MSEYILSSQDRKYILSGNYRMLDHFAESAHLSILKEQKKYDEMLDRKNKRIAELEAEIERLREELITTRGGLIADLVLKGEQQ